MSRLLWLLFVVWFRVAPGVRYWCFRLRELPGMHWSPVLLYGSLPEGDALASGALFGLADMALWSRLGRANRVLDDEVRYSRSWNVKATIYHCSCSVDLLFGW